MINLKKHFGIKKDLRSKNSMGLVNESQNKPLLGNCKKCNTMNSYLVNGEVICNHCGYRTTLAKFKNR